MKILISDLESRELQGLFPDMSNELTIISKDLHIHHCTGCFGCWTKTPAACIIRDKYGDMGEQNVKNYLL